MRLSIDQGETKALTLAKTLVEIVMTSVRTEAEIEALTIGGTVAKGAAVSYCSVNQGEDLGKSGSSAIKKH